MPTSADSNSENNNPQDHDSEGNNSKDNEQRRFTRVVFVNHISLNKGEQQWDGTVVDISFNGILVSSDASIGVNEDDPIIGATIHFENGDRINARLVLAHHHGKFYGFSFHEIDSDSLTHLRGIIEYNLGDGHTCERELLTLFRYHQ
jgi:hypothetical protein